MTGVVRNMTGVVRNLAGRMLNLSFPLHRLPKTTQRFTESEIAIAKQPQFNLFLLSKKKQPFSITVCSTTTIRFDRRERDCTFDRERTLASSLSVTRQTCEPVNQFSSFDGVHAPTPILPHLDRQAASRLYLLFSIHLRRRSSLGFVFGARHSIARSPPTSSVAVVSVRSTTCSDSYPPCSLHLRSTA